MLNRRRIKYEYAKYYGTSSKSAKMSGVPVVNKVTILDDSVLSDKELLQDMVIVAINDALLNLAKDKEEKLGKYTGGLGGLF